MLSIFYTVLISKDVQNYRVSIDNTTYKREPILIAVANGIAYGGGIIPTPNARIDDGKLDICLACQNIQEKFKILTKLLPKYKAGKHLELSQIDYIQSKKIEISSDKSMCINFDGEIIHNKNIEFQILPNMLLYRKF